MERTDRIFNLEASLFLHKCDSIVLELGTLQKVRSRVSGGWVITDKKSLTSPGLCRFAAFNH